MEEPNHQINVRLSEKAHKKLAEKAMEEFTNPSRLAALMVEASLPTEYYLSVELGDVAPCKAKGWIVFPLTPCFVAYGRCRFEIAEIGEDHKAELRKLLFAQRGTLRLAAIPKPDDIEGRYWCGKFSVLDVTHFQDRVELFIRSN